MQTNVHPLFAKILRQHFPLSNDDVREIRAEAIEWIHNTGEHPPSNTTVMLLCNEVLHLRGEE